MHIRIHSTLFTKIEYAKKPALYKSYLVIIGSRDCLARNLPFPEVFSILFKKWQSCNNLGRIVGEPVDVVSSLGIDGGSDVGVAVVAPGDDAAELPVVLADERAARVAVAGGGTVNAGAELVLREFQRRLQS